MLHLVSKILTYLLENLNLHSFLKSAVDCFKVWSENVEVNLDYKPATDFLSTLYMYRRILRGRVEVSRYLELDFRRL